jgi:hypothetical protein
MTTVQRPTSDDVYLRTVRPRPATMKRAKIFICGLADWRARHRVQFRGSSDLRYGTKRISDSVRAGHAASYGGGTPPSPLCDARVLLDLSDCL